MVAVDKPKSLMAVTSLEENPKKFMEQEEQAYKKRMLNLPAGNVIDYYKALRGEGGDGEFKSQSEVKGHDLRNAIKNLNFYSLSFQELNDAFGMATQSYKKTLLLEEK